MIDRVPWLIQAVNQSPASIFITDLDGLIEYVNAKFTRMTGYSEEEAIGANPRILHSGLTPPEVYDDLWATIKAGEVWEGELRNRRKEGEIYWEHLRVSPLRDDDGTLSHFLAIQEDITERKITEERLRHSEAILRQFADNVKEAFFLMELPEWRTLYISPTFEEIWGFPVERAYENPMVWFEALHPEDRPTIERVLRANEAGESTVDRFRVVRPDGEVRHVRARVFPIFADDGSVHRLAGLAEDVTQQVADEKLFRESQKLEAVGRLAGGIAHDFNNLLTVILAEAQLMEADLSAESNALESLQEIVKAGERAAALTGQLLAFSRRQVVAPEIFRLNDLIVDMESMLNRIIGENVRVTTRLAPDAGLVRADRNQMEQVLANLVVNAKDALPDGGEISIETSNVELDEDYTRTREGVTPGEYVKMTVSDTGIGMSEEVRARVFEPFFTTKEPGKGTGLGLATSYGLVKQGGGHIGIYSEPGLGTTATVFLPRVEDEPSAIAELEDLAPRAGGNEVILLVEDETAVRRVGVRVLRSAGYQVLPVPDAEEALELLDEFDGEIHLLFTDVLLPGLSGRELADRVTEARPGIRVLFTSGYTDDVILQHRLLEADVNLLQKPFSARALTDRVREVLDRPHYPGRAS